MEWHDQQVPAHANQQRREDRGGYGTHAIGQNDYMALRLAQKEGPLRRQGCPHPFLYMPILAPVLSAGAFRLNLSLPAPLGRRREGWTIRAMSDWKGSSRDPGLAKSQSRP